MALVDLLTFDTLFRIIATSENPPHQIIVTLLTKALDWTAATIVQESFRTLSNLLQLVETELVKGGLGKQYVESRFEELRRQMGLTTLHVLSRNRMTYDAYRDLLGEQGQPRPFGACKVGSTTLEEYYRSQNPKQRAAQVAHWWESILRHARVSYTALDAMRRTGANALPHEALAFAYVRLLGWQPHRFAKYASRYSLEALTRRLGEHMVRDKRLHMSIVQEALEPLQQRLGESVETMVGQQRRLRLTRRTPAALRRSFAAAVSVPRELLKQRSGHTRLTEYFTLNDKAVQVQWWCMAAAASALFQSLMTSTVTIFAPPPEPTL